MTRRELAEWVCEARQRTWELVSDLNDDQLLGPRLAILNPLLWEIGHIAWFQEKWVLRKGGITASVRPDADALYDSAAVAHDTRWGLLLPKRDETIAYMRAVRDHVVEQLRHQAAGKETIYFTLLSVFHEDMHTEAITYTRQTLGYPAPNLRENRGEARNEAGPLPGDVEISGGQYSIGAATPSPRHSASDEREEALGTPFVFDNEKWAHPVEVRPFAIARAPVSQAEFAAFVDEGGYLQQRFWSEDGWCWREQAEARHPVYWRQEAPGRWLRRDFERWVTLEPDRPIVHVNWHEAEAYCRWAGRRLPSEAEWEVSACMSEGHKRRFPWGDRSPRLEQANLDWRRMGCVDVAAHPAGESACGCRQMIGNVWEWTATAFLPYPGFVADPYREYSAPWFGTHKVLRGGCWATRSRLLRNTWRNFYQPERRDVFAGFRTCALTP
jgi:iron(II)-dependent oxidoreductase